jgi:hypothetical protein
MIPWVQILELLGRLPEGTTGRLLERNLDPTSLDTQLLRRRGHAPGGALVIKVHREA